MTWTTKDFRTFPARYPQSLREAAAFAPEPVLFSAYPNRSEAEAEATRLRQYRHLIRNSPGTDFALSSLLEAHNFRTKIVSRTFGIFDLLLIAKPTPLSELIALNPDLRDIIPKECQ